MVVYVAATTSAKVPSLPMESTGAAEKPRAAFFVGASEEDTKDESVTDFQELQEMQRNDSFADVLTYNSFGTAERRKRLR
jgi:hypothetical protein